MVILFDKIIVNSFCDRHHNILNPMLMIIALLLLMMPGSNKAISLITNNLPAYPALKALQGCNQNGPLGLTTGLVQDSQISASSNYPPEWDRGCGEKFARLYQPNGVGWCAKFKSASEWLQVDLGVPAKVTGLMTQGRGDGEEWVTSFLVSHSVDAYHWLYVSDQYGNKRIFDGNVDSYSVKHSYLDTPVLARYIKFHTAQWHKHPSMRVEIVGCQVCRSQLGLPPYGKVTASSEKNSGIGNTCQPEDGFIITNKAWCARHDNGDQWLQFDIGPPTLITGFVTKGRGDRHKKQWVTKYKISYSNDTKNWIFYKENGITIKEFAGNSEKIAESYQYLSNPFVARFIRFHPTAWNKHISLRAGILGCPYEGDCATGFMKINDYTPCVENLAFHKESFINNRRQYKRHVQSQWVHGQAGRAVDGQPVDKGLHSCTILDNFYVERPTWMVDLGRKALIAGVIIMTWDGNKQAGQGKSTQQDYMHNLDKISVFVDSKQQGDINNNNNNNNQHHNNNNNSNDTRVECGQLTRLNDALFKSRLHVQCRQPVKARYVFIEAWGAPNRFSRLFGAVLCEVMVYE